jgi:nitroreductase/dihydropteridine reductase
MEHDIRTLVARRYTTKVFDPAFRISPEQMDEIKRLLQFAPSSTNSQPWHFVISDTDEGKSVIARAATGRYESNLPKIKNASAVIVMCARSTIDEAYLQTLLQNEERDGRFINPEMKSAQHAGRSFYANMHRFEMKDVQQWTEKQVYLALGFILFGVSLLGLDACPMEGFDPTILNRELGLREKGFTSSLLVAIGKHDESDDYNKKLPKSRLSEEIIFTKL